MSSADLAQLNMQANKAAQNYMGKFAWPTVLLGLATPTALGGSLWAWTAGYIPFITCFVIFFVATFAAYTMVHEAAHGNISGNHKNLVWVNNLIGTLNAIVAMIPLSTHRLEHLVHHRYTNDPAQDPDCVTNENHKSGIIGFVSFATGFFIDANLYALRDHGNGVPATRAMKIKFTLELICAFGWRLAILTQVPLVEGLILVIGTFILAAYALIYWFAFRPHLPYETTDRYRNTNSFHIPVWARPLQWLLLGQDLHAIHHLFPRVPFYHYRRLFRDIEPIMRAHDAPIIGAFDKKPVAEGMI